MLVAAQSAAPEASLEGRVREYAAQLSEPRTRERALDRLGHLGLPALPLLRRAGASREALESVAADVELHEKIRDSYGPPHTFTFDGAEDSVGSFLSRIEDAAGCSSYRYLMDAARRISVPLKDASFWEALDAICRAGELVYSPYIGDQLYISPTHGAPMPERPRSYHGPLVVLVERFTLERRILFDRTTEELSARLLCAWERHVSPRGLRRCVLTRVEDDTGRSLLPAAGKTEPAAALPAAKAMMYYDMLEVKSLKPPAPGAKKIAVFEGTLDLEFPERVERAPFVNPADSAPACRNAGEVAVDLRSFSAGNQEIAAEISLSFPDEREAAACRVGPRTVELVHEGKARISSYVFNLKTEKNVVSFGVRVRGLPRPAEVRELVVRVARGCVVKPVPFRFTDVELK